MAQTSASTDITPRMAAEMENSSVSDYVRTLTVQRAMDLVARLRLRETTEIPEDAFNQLMASLDEPDSVSPRMRRAYDYLWQIELD